MSLADLNSDLDALHLLKHPFYQAWSAGELSLDTLKTYAREYYHHVGAFPCYVSGVHSRCRHDAEARQVLLGNLNEEEDKEAPHPKLWRDFGQALGCTGDELNIEAAPSLPETEGLVAGYYDLVEHSYAKGLGALYAYERQTPEVSISKRDGLKAFYGIDTPEALKFFDVHVHADEWHAQECGQLIQKLSAEQQQVAYEGARQAARLLWNFLDGMMKVFKGDVSSSHCVGVACMSVQ